MPTELPEPSSTSDVAFPVIESDPSPRPSMRRGMGLG